MRSIAIVMSALALAACHADRRERASIDPRCAARASLTSAGVGPLRFGDSLAASAVAPCVAGDTQIVFSGIPLRAKLVRIGGASLGVVTIKGRVSHVFTADTLASTDRGVRVGSTFGDVRRAYGRLCALHGAGSRVTVSPAAAPGLHLLVDGRGWRPPGTAVSVDTLAALVPDDARVADLMVYDVAHIGDALCDRKQGEVK